MNALDRFFASQGDRYVHVFNWVDFYPVVSEVYGHPWHTGSMRGEWSQNTYVEISVSADPEGTEFLDAEDIARQFERWLTSPVPSDDMPWDERHMAREMLENAEPDIDSIMWDLCRRGLIAPGLYLMKVWW